MDNPQFLDSWHWEWPWAIFQCCGYQQATNTILVNQTKSLQIIPSYDWLTLINEMLVNQSNQQDVGQLDWSPTNHPPTQSPNHPTTQPPGTSPRHIVALKVSRVLRSAVRCSAALNSCGCCAASAITKGPMGDEMLRICTDAFHLRDSGCYDSSLSLM